MPTRHPLLPSAGTVAWAAFMQLSGALRGPRTCWPAVTAAIRDGAPVEFPLEPRSRSVLMSAAQAGRMRLLRLLLNRGAAIERVDDHGRTALMHAAWFGHESATRLLLDRGAAIDARDNLGRTALVYALSAAQSGVVRLLCARGANLAPQTASATPLLVLAECSVECFRVLLEYGADPLTPDALGHPALGLFTGHPETRRDFLAVLDAVLAHPERANDRRRVLSSLSPNECRLFPRCRAIETATTRTAWQRHAGPSLTRR